MHFQCGIFSKLQRLLALRNIWIMWPERRSRSRMACDGSQLCSVAMFWRFCLTHSYFGFWIANVPMKSNAWSVM